MTTIDTTTTAKATLLAALQSERDRWEALIAEAGPDRLTTPGVCGDQSVKDLLGHLTAYTRRWGAELHGIATGTQPTIRDLFDVDALPDDAPTWDFDQQNAAIRALYAPLPTETVLAKWRAAHDLLRDSISALTESQIATPGAITVDGIGDRPLAAGIAGDTFAHHTHHAAEVRAWLDKA
jgi:hypothetical protein